MRAKQLQILNFSFAYLCLRSATPFPFRTTRFLSGGAHAPCSLQIVRQVLSNTRFHDYACVYFGNCLSRQQSAQCRQHCHQRQRLCRRHQRYILILQEQTSRRLWSSLMHRELVRRMRSHNGVFWGLKRQKSTRDAMRLTEFSMRVEGIAR